MDVLTVERLGGLAGFGLPGSRIRSRGTLPAASLSASDQAAVEDLFRSRGGGLSPAPDAFRYRISRETSAGRETVEAPESAVPPALRASVKDELE